MREAAYTFGPRFFKDEKTGKDMFTFTIDSANRMGPMAATDGHKALHPGAWHDYMASLTEDVAEAPKRPRGRPRKVNNGDTA